MDSTEPRSTDKFTFWPGLWMPLAVFVTGLVLTAVFADMAEDQARSRSDDNHQAGHLALVHTLQSAMAVPGQPPGSTSKDWLENLFAGNRPGDLGLRIDTLERHSKRPLLKIPANAEFVPALVLRTEVEAGPNRWILTSVPLQPFIAPARARNSVWVAGVLLSTLAALPPLLLSRRLQVQARHIRKLEQQASGALHQISNLRVEKGIIRQALNDSEERSRDLINLSGAVIWELDESGHIGFASPQVADLLNLAPADLAGQSFETLIEPGSRANYRLTLQAARTERSVARIDLNLLTSKQARPIPVTLRIRALDDPLHGLAGYRMSALPNPAA